MDEGPREGWGLGPGDAHGGVEQGVDTHNWSQEEGCTNAHVSILLSIKRVYFRDFLRRF